MALEEEFGGDVEAAAEAERGSFEGWKVERYGVGEGKERWKVDGWEGERQGLFASFPSPYGLG
jgi:hypothetical protein